MAEDKIRTETEIRIIAAVVHQETEEVEIIIEQKEIIGFLNEKTKLTAIWVDCEKELIAKNK